jgi:hypothetical protein
LPKAVINRTRTSTYPDHNEKKDKKWEKMVNKKLKKIINKEFGNALGPSKINKKK